MLPQCHRLITFLCMLGFLFFQQGTTAQEIVQGSNANNIYIPEGGRIPTVSSIYISYDGIVKIHNIQGTINLNHQNPRSLVMFLDHPGYRDWEREFLRETGRDPSYNEMVDSDLTILLDEVADPQLFNFAYRFPTSEAMTIDGNWALRVYDTANDGITGFLVGWTFTLEVTRENPPQMISWTPENGSIISGKEVHFSCLADDPDGDPIIYKISFYDGNSLLYDIDTNHLVVDTTRGVSPDGFYRVDFIAMSTGTKQHNFDVVSCHIMINNEPLTWEYCYPGDRETVSGIVPVKAAISNRTSATYYYHVSGLGAANFGETLEAGIAFKDFFNSRLLKDGFHTLFFLAVDDLGNNTMPGDLLGYQKVLVDNTPPVIYFTTPLPAGNITERDTIDFVISDFLSNIQSFEIVIDDELFDRVVVSDPGTVQEVSYPVPRNLQTGYHTITVRARDHAMNLESASLIFYLKRSF